MVNIFNRKKENNTPEPTPVETQIIEQLKEQKEFNQLLIKEIKQLKKDNINLLNYLNNEFEIIATDITKVKQGLYDEISKKSYTINEHLKTMNDIKLTREDIHKFIDIGYEYLQKEYEFEIIPDNTTPETTPKKDDPLTIEDVLNTLEEPTLKAEPAPKKTKQHKETKKHLMNIAESLHQPYSLKLLPNGHFINRDNTNTKQTKFTINDVIDLKEKIPYYHKKGYTYKTITMKYYPLSQGVVKRLIWNIEEGNFDEIINDYYKGKNTTGTGLNFNINDRYKKRYRLKSLDGIDIHRKGQGSSKLGFNILDVLYIKENIPRWIHEQTPRAQVAEETGMAPDRLQRVIYNVMEGTFDEYLKDFEDPGAEHKFTIVNNKLYFDTKNTGLELSTCRMILHDYTNAENKYRCLKNLIRTYKDIKPHYIVTITRYYDDIEFRDLILHNDETISVTVVNNPEKRRDYGTSVII